MWTPISTCDWIMPVLVGSQRAGLLEHGVVDADLADVVEQAHQVEVAPLVGRHAQLLGEPDGDPRHALGVARGVGVLGVDGRGQGADDAEEQLLQVGVEPGVGLLGGDQRGDRLEQLDRRRGLNGRSSSGLSAISQPVEPWRVGGDGDDPPERGVGGRPGLVVDVRPVPCRAGPGSRSGSRSP